MPRATLRSFRLTPIALAATLLAGCNPIGGGSGPVSLTINGPDGTANAETGTIYECIRAGVTAALNFENGSAGDFTERVLWESDNEAVLRVSNSGTEPVPGTDGLFFGRGVLTPVSPGVARVTATFSDFVRTIVVTVRPVPTMFMEQRDVGTGLNRPLAAIPPPEGSTEPLPPEPLPGTPAPRTRQRMGPLTTIDLTVIADLDGVPTRVDPAAQWAFDAAPDGATTPNGDIALIDAEGVVTTAAADPRSLVARASFQPCGRSLATEIAVSPIQALTLVPEFGAQPLIAPNTERYFALADFGDGPEQDISLTTTYTSGTTATAAFLSAFIGIPNLLSSVAASADPVVLTATTPDPDADDDTVGPVTATIEQTVVTDTLVSIALEPQNPTAIAGSSLVCPLRLVGTYASGAQQDITRRGSYVSETQTIGTVSSTPLTSGQISVGGREPGTTMITATVIEGTNTLTATTTYALVAPATPAPATCPQTFDPLPGQVITP